MNEVSGVLVLLGDLLVVPDSFLVLPGNENFLVGDDLVWLGNENFLWATEVAANGIVNLR